MGGMDLCMQRRDLPLRLAPPKCSVTYEGAQGPAKMFTEYDQPPGWPSSFGCRTRIIGKVLIEVEERGNTTTEREGEREIEQEGTGWWVVWWTWLAFLLWL